MEDTVVDKKGIVNYQGKDGSAKERMERKNTQKVTFILTIYKNISHGEEET